MLNKNLEALIKIILKENFPGLEDIARQYCPNTDSSSESDSMEDAAHLTKQPRKIDYSNLNPRLLENVAHEFNQNYKAKTEYIAREIKQSI